MIKGLIFDLDGTLLSTETDLCTAVNKMRADFNCEPLSELDVKSYLGDGIRMLVTRSLPSHLHDKLEEALDIFYKSYASCFNDSTRPYESVYETLKFLQKNYRLSIVSNKTQMYVDQLVKTHFPDICFDYIYGDAINHKRKPDSQGIIESMNAMGCRENEVILIGDSLVDIKTAQVANIQICPVAWGFQSKESLAQASGIIPLKNISDLILFINQINYN